MRGEGFLLTDEKPFFYKLLLLNLLIEGGISTLLL